AGVGRAPRQVEHIVDNVIYPLHVRQDDFQQALFRLVVLAVCQQSGGVIDGAERVANFVGNGGGHAPERVELHLLRFVCQLAVIFKEHQGQLAVFHVQVGKAYQQCRAGRGKLDAWSLHGRVDAPAVVQLAQSLGQGGAAEASVGGDQGFGGRVGQQDAEVRVDNQDAGAHALHN